LYDQHLGSLIFAPYADDLASRLADMRHGRILETAAGTGVVTRALVSSLPEGVSIEATDLNQPTPLFLARTPPRTSRYRVS
jgi:methylase of polypeptide subunit release factors